MGNVRQTKPAKQKTERPARYSEHTLKAYAECRVENVPVCRHQVEVNEWSKLGSDIKIKPEFLLACMGETVHGAALGVIGSELIKDIAEGKWHYHFIVWFVIAIALASRGFWRLFVQRQQIARKINANLRELKKCPKDLHWCVLTNLEIQRRRERDLDDIRSIAGERASGFH